jgi:large subunit ribosomal protein L6
MYIEETMATVRRVSIPQGVKAELNGPVLSVEGPRGRLERNFRFPQIAMALEGDEFVITTASDRKRIMAMVGTIAAHTGNMCKGVSSGFEYHMKVVYSHFPIQLKITGNRLEIHNFLGEKKARYADIVPGVKARVSGDEVVLSGINRELVGMTSANIEHATRIRNRDPRIFQDGIYLVER